MTQKTALLWFRQDLRLTDHPALHAALEDGYAIIPVFILDDVNAEQWKRGGASRWWLHQSLKALNGDLGEHMVFRHGDAQKIIPDLIEQTDASAIYWNRCYEPWRIKRDKIIKTHLTGHNIDVHSFNGSLLWEPWEVLKDDGTPYKVFSPYYKRGCLKNSPPPRDPLPRPDSINFARPDIDCGTLDDLALMPDIKWYETMAQLWTPGENGAQERLDTFIENGLHDYKDGRNNPAQDNVSYLSPHLHHGEISPVQVWHRARQAGYAEGWERDTDHFCSELGWREFSYYLLYHFHHITWENLNEKFNAFPWIPQESQDLERWRRGQTGIPIVDAGMRQLWQTGWMHNRVRMIVASLLVKNMLVHWHRGAEWFWDTLVDADLANNSASWQWVAGCGADAAPYFRIFNPVLQGKKFDPDGTYVRQFVPELKNMDNKYIHEPWESPVPPATYPKPIVNLKDSRKKALAAYEAVKSQ